MHYPTAAPAISCFALSVAEFHRRTDAAEAAESQKQATYGNTFSYGREIMWHPAFAAECVALLSKMPLSEIGAWLLDCHAEGMNEGRALDLTDYGYLADVLREGLADSPTPLAALRLARALAWVEQAGEALLPTTHAATLPMVAQSTPTPLATAA